MAQQGSVSGCHCQERSNRRDYGTIRFSVSLRGTKQSQRLWHNTIQRVIARNEAIAETMAQHDSACHCEERSNRRDYGTTRFSVSLRGTKQSQYLFFTAFCRPNSLI